MKGSDRKQGGQRESSLIKPRCYHGRIFTACGWAVCQQYWIDVHEEVAAVEAIREKLDINSMVGIMQVRTAPNEVWVPYCNLCGKFGEERHQTDGGQERARQDARNHVNRCSMVINGAQTEGDEADAGEDSRAASQG